LSGPLSKKRHVNIIQFLKGAVNADFAANHNRIIREKKALTQNNGNRYGYLHYSDCGNSLSGDRVV
jgi:hypothetical protein